MPFIDGIVGGIGREPDIGRRQELHATVLGVLGRFAHLLRGLNGADDRAGDGHRQARLLHLRLEGRPVRLARFEDIDRLRRDLDVARRRDHIGTHLPIRLARLEDDVARGAADGTRRGAGAGTLLIGAEHLAAEGETDAAGTEDPALLRLLVVRLGVVLRCRGEGQVAAGVGVVVGGGAESEGGSNDYGPLIACHRSDLQNELLDCKT